MCDTRIDPTAAADQTDLSYFSMETQFVLSTVLAGIVNNPPVLLSETDILMEEDSGKVL